MSQVFRIPEPVLARVLQHVIEGYPSEVCGILLAQADAPDVAVATERMDNVQDRYHQLDPVQFPRTSRTAYRFNDMQHLRLLEKAKEQGQVERVIYHSHIDVGAYFSDEDVAQALWDGAPRFPGVDYLVVGTRDGKPVEANLFRYDAGSFHPHKVELPTTKVEQP
ncbi:MAG: Mov34/MPN/PAD-1 family protein [Myxococcota bacterium]